MTDTNFPLEDILDAIMIEESEPSYEALMRWSEYYPEHRDALAKFFATWAVQCEMSEETAIDEERLASITVSHALNIVYRQNKEANSAQQQADASSAATRLLATARAAGASEEDLVVHAKLDSDLIAKLDRHRLTDVKQTCFRLLATVLNTVADRIQEMATGPPIDTAVQHKAKGKPRPTTEDFMDAIEHSSLPEKTKQFWREAD